MDNTDKLLADFKEILEIEWSIPLEYREEVEKLITSIGVDTLVPYNIRKKGIYEAICKKHDLNRDAITRFIDLSASYKIYFNYHQKELIKSFYNSWNREGFLKFVHTVTSTIKQFEKLSNCFDPVSYSYVTAFFKNGIANHNKPNEIIESIWASYICRSFPIDKIHNFFNQSSQLNDDYISDYNTFLRSNYPDRYERDLGLSILKIDQNLFNLFADRIEFFDYLFSFINDRYHKISNHCYFSILIEPIKDQDTNIEWEVFSNIVLYCEKFIEEKLVTGYFHPEKIAEETKIHIQDLDETKAAFEVANGGFTYKDCLIVAQGGSKHVETQDNNYNLLLLFEKSNRDERPIPCPACRSLNVRGNSYPTLGVKSWECNNILCFEKSKFNRGKRYALASLIKQEAIDNDNNAISGKTIKEFRLDVTNRKTEDEILEFLITHYSLYNDTVEIVNMQTPNSKLFNRSILLNDFTASDNTGLYDAFFDGAFFKRFNLYNESTTISKIENISQFENHQIYHGDSFWVLKQLEANSIDGAVTSPPYYNARSYSQWPNIYCYLYDMMNNAREVFRTLKPGAAYLYNIFDYFDNERNVVFSAMGKKRMILGSYIIYLFRSIGFELIDNIVWYKGHIQGNRSHNQGNLSPYYQAPLNCYEHIFYFRKPGNEVSSISYPKILKAHPVVKMINGKNILGHTAPFPPQIPQLLTSQLPIGSTILDPYAGSFTTARQCQRDGQKSISIELNEEYCKLGQSLLSNEKTLLLFN